MINKILLVEDETELADMLAAYLKNAGFSVKLETNGANVMSVFKQYQPDFVLLDLMLPNVDGLTLCNQIRQVSQVPIIMLTARVDEIDRLLGLEIGADDYICKPYSPREVVARVKAVSRRYLADVNPQPEPNGLILNENELEAYWQGQALNLTLIEFRLLQAMVKAPRQVFTREQLMEKIYPDERIVSDRTIDSHITKLRKKLNSANQNQDMIQSVYGAGYRLQLV
ncbi:response regulator [Catenovulum sp. 2E275]|uniref:response regulator n=1 Tax=Catenovulum sp. 2E275 TaxID=2980497 RepID=UPI0021D10C1C|nr:response regulator [Catenovulum sp. 2E275]MCU4677107.1 response regulator [Catenovulum sp. 2E275]